MTIDPKFTDHGYRLEEIAAERAGEPSRWYYGRPGPDGKLVDRVGAFASSAEAIKHLEGEIFSDEED